MLLTDLYQFLSKFSFSHANTQPYPLEPEDAFAFSVADSSYAAVETSAGEEYAPGGRRSRKECKAPAPESNGAVPVSGTQYEGLITEDIVIDGSVTSGSNLKVAGVIKGNVACGGNIEVRGRIQGDVTGKRITMFAAEVTGDVKAEESLKLEGGVITGAVEGATAEIDGTVNGNITLSGLLNIKAAAVIKGDITAASVAMAENASVNGKLSVGGGA